LAVSRVKTWIAAEVLTAADLNAEFNNILDNGLSVVSPWTGNMDAGANRLTNLAAGTVSAPALAWDADTGLYRSAAGTLDHTLDGVRGLSVTTVASGVNYVLITPAATNTPVLIGAGGTDANISIRLVPVGTGFVIIPAGGYNNSNVVPGVGVNGDNDTGFAQLTTGSIDLVANARTALRASAAASATNFIEITPAAASATPFLQAAGGDTNIGLTIDTKGTGSIVLGSADTGSIEAATGFKPASAPGGTPAVNTLYAPMLPRAWVSVLAAFTLEDSFNVTSITDQGTGVFTVVFDRAFGSQAYVPVGISEARSTTAMFVATDQTLLRQTTSCKLNVIRSDTAALTDASAFVVFFGRQ
jgi:hypothetical protein